MQEPKHYDKGEIIGCYEIIEKKEYAEDKINEQTTEDGYALWICKCTHTKDTCNAWRSSCLQVERSSKKLDRSKPPQKCKDWRPITASKTNNALQAAKPKSGNTGNKCFDCALESVIVFDPINLKKQTRQFYGANIKVDNIKPYFEGMFDDIYVNSLGLAPGDKVEKDKIRIEPIKWKPIVAKYVAHYQSQIPLWNALIDKSEMPIYEGIVEFIQGEAERLGGHSNCYPNLDTFTAVALAIGTIGNEKAGFHNDAEFGTRFNEYEFYKNPDFKRKYVSQYAAVAKEKCLYELTEHLIENVQYMVEMYNKGEGVPAKPKIINQIYGFDAEISLAIEDKRVRVRITKQLEDNGSN